MYAYAAPPRPSWITRRYVTCIWAGRSLGPETASGTRCTGVRKHWYRRSTYKLLNVPMHQAYLVAGTRQPQGRAFHRVGACEETFITPGAGLAARAYPLLPKGRAL